MKINFIFKSTIFALLSALVLAKNDCDAIKKYINKRGLNYKKNIEKCNVDKNGNVITLDIRCNTLEEKDVNKILSYNTIKKLTYYIGIFGNDTPNEYGENFHFSKYGYFPSRIPNLPNLEDLTLAYSGLREYDRGNIGNDTLRDMVSTNSLKKLALIGLNTLQINIIQIGELINLEELYIINAAQQRNYKYLSRLVNLKVLEVTEFHHDPFVKFPPVSNFKKLEKLVIRGNLFTAIPTYISNFKNLKTLDLSHNKITKIPKFLSKLKNLEYIDLSYNMEITGKTLANSKLKVCKYEGDSNVCIAKDMECLKDNTELKKCANTSTSNLKN